MIRTPNRRHMGKCIARGSKKALVDHCFSDPGTFPIVRRKICRLLQGEMKTMCAEKTASVLRSNSYETLKNFKWEDLLQELKVHAPTFQHILQSCTGKSSRKSALIGICASILLKSRCAKMSIVQKRVMLILHAGHCGKQVHTVVYTLSNQEKCLHFICRCILDSNP